jgi:hypothetical protein
MRVERKKIHICMAWGLKTKDKLQLYYHLWLVEASYLYRLFSKDQQ